MTWFVQFLTSSLGKKVLMALTGLFLSVFLIVHLIGNLQLLKNDEGFSFNVYAVFMTGFPLIKFVSYGLYFFILLHAFQGLILAYQNWKSRPIAYAVTGKSSSWASRNMAVLGTILLIFLMVHMGDFWFKYKFGYVPYKQYTHDLLTGKLAEAKVVPPEIKIESKLLEITQGPQKITVVKDLYLQVKESFKVWWLVVLYCLAMVALGFHLAHGFQSAFQSLGVNHPKYNGIFKGIGIIIFGVLIPLGFMAMPLFFYFTK